MRVVTISPGVQNNNDGKTWPPLWSGDARPSGHENVPIEKAFADVVECDGVRRLCLEYGLPYFLSMPGWRYQRKSRGKWLRGKGRRVIAPEVVKADKIERGRVQAIIEDRNWPAPVKQGVFDIVYGGEKPREAATKTGVCPKRLSNCARRVEKLLERVSDAAI
jgi:hypothetical protein